MSYKYVILRDPDSMECVIREIDANHPESYEVCGYAKSMRQAYFVVDYTHEMER